MMTSPSNPARDAAVARKRIVLLIMAGVLLMVVAAAGALTLVSSLMWSKQLEIKTDGDAVMEHIRQQQLQKPPAPTQPQQEPIPP